MKKILLVAALALSTGLAMAQVGVQNEHTTNFSMKGGKVMMTMPMDKDMTMSDGTKFMRDGTIMKKDGSKMMMKDGDSYDFAGNKTGVGVQNEHNSGVTMKGGKVMMMKDGKTMPMDKDMTMADGTKFMRDGTIMKKDGSKIMMKDGDSYDFSGTGMRK